MLRFKIVLFFFFLGYTLLGQDKNSLGSRWLISTDVPIILPAYNSQKDYYDNNIKTIADREVSIGLELIKYYPNNISFISLIPRIISRNTIIKSANNISYGADQLQLNGLFNFQFSSKKHMFEDITKYFLGSGVAISYLSSVHFKLFDKDYIIEEPDLINKIRLEGLFNLGILEDVFNIDVNQSKKRRTSLSKFNILVRLPLFNLGYNFSNKYLVLPPLLSDFQKTKDFRLAFEIRYNHLIDVKRNIKSNYSVVYDGKWTEITDPIKNIFPPIVNNSIPHNNYFGNFYFTFNIYGQRDTIAFSNSNSTLFIQNKNFNNFSFGYTFNFFGNYRKYHGQFIGQEIWSKNNWRRNLFISGGLRNVYLNANKENVYFKKFQTELEYSAGLKLKRIDKNLDLILGCKIFQNLSSELITNFPQDPAEKKVNNGYFLGIGKSNYYLILETRIQNFVLLYYDEFINNLSVRFSVGF